MPLCGNVCGRMLCGTCTETRLLAVSLIVPLDRMVTVRGAPGRRRRSGLTQFLVGRPWGANRRSRALLVVTRRARSFLSPPLTWKASRMEGNESMGRLPAEPYDLVFEHYHGWFESGSWQHEKFRKWASVCRTFRKSIRERVLHTIELDAFSCASPERLQEFHFRLTGPKPYALVAPNLTKRLIVYPSLRIALSIDRAKT